MCGIAGILSLKQPPPSVEVIRRMTRELTHRGPDGKGTWMDGPVGFGHTRLAIIDIAGGAQPMHDPGTGLTLTFNGEIFNHVELRERLAALGHCFRTRSDTEVLLHAFAEWDTACVDELNGQWAFAIWDAHRQRLVLSRDRFGIRPLYYSQNAERLVFASEIRALLAEGGIPRRFDARGLHECFTHWCPIAPRTAFAGISELLPGHTMTVEGGAVRISRYWELDFGEIDRERSPASWAEELHALLDDATHLRLRRSDVPVAAYLSGGLDSAATVALARTHASLPLQTFSIAFEDPEFDERRWQHALVDSMGVEHHELLCDADTLCARFPDVVQHAETPLLRTAPAPLFLLAEEVRRRGFKVVLTGEGADEMLGGYDLFKETKIRRFWAQRPDSAWRWRLLQRLYPWLPRIQRQGPEYLAAIFALRAEELDSPWFSHMPRWRSTEGTQIFFRRELREAWAAQPDAAREALAPRLPPNFAQWPSLAQAQWIETSSFLPGYLLSSQGDRMAMASGVEGRFPFLDHRVAELACKMPPRIKLRGLDEKRVLKDAMRSQLPQAITRRSKQPYRAPEAASFFDFSDGGARAEWVEQLTSAGSLTEVGAFDPDRTAKLVTKARHGRALSPRDGMALVGILSTQALADRLRVRMETHE